MKSLLIGESPAGSESSFFRKTWGTWKTAAAVSSAAVVFGVAILVLSILAAISPLKVFPQTDPATESAATVQIEYYLPYPGVLPDSPLYKLKMVRDRVKLWITRDATKRTDLELLYADKRINAALALADGGKETLAVSTATKAEKYLEQAVNRVLEQNGQGKDVKSQMMKLEKAAARHEELLKNISVKTSGPVKEVADITATQTRMLMEKLGQAILEAE